MPERTEHISPEGTHTILTWEGDVLIDVRVSSLSGESLKASEIHKVSCLAKYHRKIRESLVSHG
jgi:hypothetical protein